MMKNRKKSGQVNPRGTRVYDPLAAVPLAPDNVEQKRDSCGRIHLRLNVPVKGLRKRLADWLGYKYEKTLELDEMGTLFYERVDGRRSLRGIAGEMAGKRGCTQAEMNECVAKFTRSLMSRNMILLRVGGKPSDRGE